MGGGGKPLNIFKLNLGDEPREVLNWRLWFAVFSFGKVPLRDHEEKCHADTEI